MIIYHIFYLIGQIYRHKNISKDYVRFIIEIP